MEVTAAVAVVLSVIGGLVSAYAALRQRKTEAISVVVNATQEHMKLLTAENADLRERLNLSEKARGEETRDLRDRLRSAESTIGDLRVQVAHCDADKNRLRMEVDELKRAFGRSDIGQRNSEPEHG